MQTPACEKVEIIFEIIPGESRESEIRNFSAFYFHKYRPTKPCNGTMLELFHIDKVLQQVWLLTD